jgi:hypothetical protein
MDGAWPDLHSKKQLSLKLSKNFPPFDDNGNVGWTFEGEPTAPREKRWLELYRKHEGAIAAWIKLIKLLG